MGFEYELLERLADHLGLSLKITVAHDINELFDMLNSGKGDLIAYGLTVTEERQEMVSFTDHYFVTHQVLVQRMPENWRSMPGYAIDSKLKSSVLDLIGDTVHVRKNSSYYARMMNLMQEIGGAVHIDTMPGDMPTGEIIRKVVDGEIKYTVADYNIAAINKTYYPELDIRTRISFDQRIAWATRNNSPRLLEAINQWLVEMKKGVDYYVIYNKYFKNRKSFRKRIESEFYSKNAGKISRYDDIVRKYTDTAGWDWRLISSQIYQESGFKPKARSWAGAKGLMQLMPATAAELGVTRITDPEQNIRAGIRYMKKLWRRWNDIPDSVQRLKFTLASYNCGYNHVRDAWRLADKYGADQDVWDGNTEDYILKLSIRKFYQDEVVRYGFLRGREPYSYVREIFGRYEHYKRFIPR